MSLSKRGRQTYSPYTRKVSELPTEPSPTSPSADVASAIRILLQQAELDPDFIAPIRQMGDPVLRQPAERFAGQVSAEELAAFLALMRRTMLAAPGVGLAAPQIGVPVRIAVVEDQFPISEDIAHARERAPLPYTALINPRYQPASEDTVAFYEGCLSFTGFQGVVARPREVEVSFDTPSGQAMTATYTGWQARIMQHECDHLDGTVYVDKMRTRSLTTSEEYAARWAQPTIDDAARALRF